MAICPSCRRGEGEPSRKHKPETQRNSRVKRQEKRAEKCVLGIVWLQVCVLKEQTLLHLNAPTLGVSLLARGRDDDPTRMLLRFPFHQNLFRLRTLCLPRGAQRVLGPSFAIRKWTAEKDRPCSHLPGQPMVGLPYS